MQIDLRQLEQWHQNEQYEEIIDAIEALSRQEWGYELISLLARAKNNNGDYDQALTLLDSIEAEGRDDELWHYRRAYAMYYLDRYSEAEQEFRKAAHLDPEDPDCWYFICMIYRYDLENDSALKEAAHRLLEMSPEMYRDMFGTLEPYAGMEPKQSPGQKQGVACDNLRVFAPERKFDPDYNLVAEMVRDSYYPDHLVEKVQEVIRRVVDWLEKCPHTYEQIQNQFDSMTIALNQLEQEFEENDSELETVARESIAETVAYILDWFGIEMDVEDAIRERDW